MLSYIKTAYLISTHHKKWEIDVVSAAGNIYTNLVFIISKKYLDGLISLRHLSLFLSGGNREKKTSPQEISITVSGAKMATPNCTSNHIHSNVGEPQKSPSRLMPNAYHSYRRHSSPSALGDSAAFEFPATAGDVQSPTEEVPEKQTRNQSSPFLTCGNIRSRAQSTSSDLTQRVVSVSRCPDENYSLSSSSTDEEDDPRFELQAPPKLRTRHRACSSGQILVTSPTVDEDSGSELGPDPFSPLATLSAPPNTPLTGSSSSHCLRHCNSDQESHVEKAKKKVLSVMGIGHEADIGSPKNTRSNSRSQSPDVCESPGIPPLVSEEDVNLSPELPRAHLGNRRPSSPSRFAKLVKEAEERLSGITSPRRPSSPSLQTMDRRPSLSMSPLNSPRSPRSPLSPSANSVNAGVVVTSSKPSRRRSSISQAAAAFAAATAGASPSPSYGVSSPTIQRFRFGKQYVCLSVCLFVCLSVCLSALPSSIPVCLSVCLCCAELPTRNGCHMECARAQMDSFEQ